MSKNAQDKFDDFVLESVDSDIAEACRKVGMDRIPSSTPIDLQIARYLKKLYESITLQKGKLPEQLPQSNQESLQP